MPHIERLPKQLSGIGFFVPVKFRQPYARWIDQLVDEEVFGDTNAEVTQRLFFKWIEDHLKVLDSLGIRGEDAQAAGYSPVKWNLPEEMKRYQIHQRPPWKVEIYGQPAYMVDCLRKTGLFGRTRVEVVRRGVESEMLYHYDQYAHWLGPLSDLKNKGQNK